MNELKGFAINIRDSEDKGLVLFNSKYKGWLALCKILKSLIPQMKIFKKLVTHLRF